MEGHGSRQAGLLAVALCSAAVAFLPALDNDFVNWDDDVYVVDSAIIKELSPG